MGLKIIIRLLACLFVLKVLPFFAIGQEQSPFVKSVADRDYVSNSLQMANGGTNRDEVLDELVRISVHSPDPKVGIGAVRALFHLGQDNERIQKDLLRIIRNRATGRTVLHFACDLLVFVADQSGAEMLLEEMQRRWEQREPSPGLKALAELGNEKCLAWLRQLNDEPSTIPRVRSYLDQFCTMIELQKEPLKLLNNLAIKQTGLINDWYVQQAMRHGVSKNDIGDKVMEFILENQTNARAIEFFGVVSICDQYGILDLEASNTCEAIKACRSAPFPRERQWPNWATLIDEKKRAFYGAQPR